MPFGSQSLYKPPRKKPPVPRPPDDRALTRAENRARQGALSTTGVTRPTTALDALRTVQAGLPRQSTTTAAHPFLASTAARAAPASMSFAPSALSASGTTSPATLAANVNPVAHGTTSPTVLGDQNFTGWAAGIRPDAADLMFSKPEALLRQVMVKMGLPEGENAGLFGMAEPYAGLANLMALIAMGSGDAEVGSKNAILNEMGDYMSQGLKRGGTMPSFASGMANITGASESSPLGRFMNPDNSPERMVSGTGGLINALADASLHPYFASAVESQLLDLEREFYQRLAFGKNPPDTFGGMLAGRGLF